MPQTSVSLNPARALLGMVAANMGSFETIARTLETAAGCEAGRILCEGTDPDRQAKVPTVDTDGLKVLGAVKREDAKEPSTPAFAQKDAVTLVKKGPIWVEAAGTLTTAMNGRPDGTAIYLVHSGADAGLLSPTDDVTTVRVYGIRVLRGATDGNLALVDFNL